VVVSLLPVVVFVISLLAGPTGCVLGIGFWTRWLRRRGRAPRFAVTTAHVLVVVAAMLIAVTALGLLWAVFATKTVSPTDRARTLGKGVSKAMNFATFGLLVAVVDGVWLAFCSWKWRRGTR
jgi:nitrate reductase gamma subunit